MFRLGPGHDVAALQLICFADDSDDFVLLEVVSVGILADEFAELGLLLARSGGCGNRRRSVGLLLRFRIQILQPVLDDHHMLGFTVGDAGFDAVDIAVVVDGIDKGFA